jgi:hypothetical protein
VAGFRYLEVIPSFEIASISMSHFHRFLSDWLVTSGGYTTIWRISVFVMCLECDGWERVIRRFNYFQAEVTHSPTVTQHRRHTRPGALSIDQLDLSSLLETSDNEGDRCNLGSLSLDSSQGPLKRSLLNSTNILAATMSPAHYKHMMRCRAVSEF